VSYVKNFVNPVPGIEYFTYEDVNTLLNIIRLWLEFVHWTRSLFHSVLRNLPEQGSVGEQLFTKLPMDLSDEFKKYLDEGQLRNFLNISTRLIAYNWQLVNSYKIRDKYSIDMSTAQLHQVADEMAAFFAGVSPFYNEDELKTLLNEYIDLKISEINALLNNDYVLENKIFDKIEDQVIEIGAYIAMGIIAMRRSSMSSCI